MKIECMWHLESTDLHISTLIKSDIENLTDRVTRKVLHLEESAIKEALIKLGWTPPGEQINTNKG